MKNNQKQKNSPNELAAYALLLIGTVFIIESVVLLIVLNYMPNFLMPPMFFAVAYLYALIKFVGGIASAAAGLKMRR